MLLHPAYQQLDVNGQQLVAKRYNKFTSDTTKDFEKVAENKRLIYADAARLAQGAVFLMSFYNRAKMLGVTDLDIGTFNANFTGCIY